MLNERVCRQEEKIYNILECVASMIIKKAKYRGRPKWLTTNLLLRMKERVSIRQKANFSRNVEDKRHARKVRNEVAK